MARAVDGTRETIGASPELSSKAPSSSLRDFSFAQWLVFTKRIRKRFEQGHVPGLADQPKAGRKDHAVTPQQVERIVALVMSPPPKGYSRWSTRQIGDR